MKTIQKKTGFTLIELLVVIAIIAVLVAILLPVLNEARDRAKVISCGAQENQLGMAIFSYANINNSFIPLLDGPQYDEWSPASPYFDGFIRDGGITNMDLFYCPSNPYFFSRVPGQIVLFFGKPKTGYGYLRYREGNIPLWWNPANKPMIKIDKGYIDKDNGYDETPLCNSLMMVDFATTADDPSIFGGGNHVDRGGNWIKGANHLYGDGHVQWWKTYTPHPYWGWNYVPLYH
jgi:prepilin-type N-terminal cleavage/methylation domain-containing protein